MSFVYVASMKTIASLAGIRFATGWEDLSTRQDPYVIGLSTIAGWYDAPRDATDAIPHWSGDGTVSLLPRLGSRMIELTGTIRGRSAAAAEDAQDALSRIRAGLLVIEGTGSAGPREADVRRTAREFERITTEVIGWSLTLLADDPLRFSSATMPLTNGTVAVPNRGDATLSPVLDLVGPHGALTIIHPGGAYTFPALGSGQKRTLDWRNGDVWNGNVRQFGVEGGRRPAVLAGGSTWTVSGLGAGTATLRRYEAWT